VRKTDSSPFFQHFNRIESFPRTDLTRPVGRTNTKKTKVKMILETTAPRFVLRANQKMAYGLKNERIGHNHEQNNDSRQDKTGEPLLVVCCNDLPIHDQCSRAVIIEYNAVIQRIASSISQPAF